MANCHVYTLMGQMPMLFITQLLVIEVFYQRAHQQDSTMLLRCILHCRMATLHYPSRTILMSDISTLILTLPPTLTLWEA